MKESDSQAKKINSNLEYNFTSDIVIGMEVHLQLNTKSKIFCACPTRKSNQESVDIPNSRTCPTCLGHPGSRPIINKKVIDWAIKIALSLDCKINPELNFSRKTYFYPDLAKNYQITQYEIPLGSKGHILLDSGKKVRINRLHIEEDPAGLIHKDTYCLADYNRSGIPLVEIVTEPEIYSPAEAREFMKKLISIVKYLGVFDEENGIIKADANISIKKHKYQRVEIKNITGFKEIERALNYEIIRQKDVDKVFLETRAWNANKGLTLSMRTKEGEADYGYIIDPDFPTINLTDNWIETIQDTIPELGHERAKRWTEELKINNTDANIIASEIKLANLFEKIIKKINEPILISRWFRREILRVLNLHNKTAEDLDQHHLIELFTLLKNKKITDRIGQALIEDIILKHVSPVEYVKEQGLESIDNESLIREMCHNAIKDSAKAILDYKSGNQKAFNSVFGKVMGQAKGKARPDIIKKILKEEIDC